MNLGMEAFRRLPAIEDKVAVYTASESTQWKRGLPGKTHSVVG
jgi:hypothetical protein